MIKSDKNFRISKRAKTMVALLQSTSDRSHLRKMLIQAELSAEAARRQSLKSKGSKNKDSAAE